MPKPKNGLNLAELKKDPRFAGMTKKKIKKALRSEHVVTSDRAAKTNVKKKKAAVKQHSKQFNRGLKKEFIVHGLPMDPNAGPAEHEEPDEPRSLQPNSRYVAARGEVAHRMSSAPSVVVDLDFAIFRDKNVC